MTNSRLEIDEFGTKRYYNSKGRYHNEYGPAVIYQNGGKYWFINDKHHRIDGPATICDDSYKSWYIDNIFIRCFEYD